MNLRKPKQIITFIFFVLAVCFVLSTFIGFASSISLDTAFYDDMVFAPADYEIVPVDDGTEIINRELFQNPIFWKSDILLFIDSIWRYTPYSNFVRVSVIPLISALMGVSFYILFSRRKSPEKNPNSAPAKILAYVEKHQGSTQQKIIDSVSRSRGSVSYQLKRLEKEKKIYIYEVSDKKYYFTHQPSSNTLEPEIMRILSDSYLSPIFTLLYNHSKLTRNKIAECLGKSPDTVYSHLKKFSTDVVVSKREGRIDYYSLTDEASIAYFMISMGSHADNNSAEA